MAKTKTPTKRPAVLDQFIADFACAATGPRTVTVRLHGRESTVSVAELRKNIRQIKPAIDWIIEHIEAVCVEAEKKTGRPRVAHR